jgi:hypothetical protein
MKRKVLYFLLFLLLFTGIYILLFSLCNLFIDHHYYFKDLYVDILFSLYQILISILLFTIWEVKKTVNYKTGLLQILFSFLLLSCIWYFREQYIPSDFIVNYIFSIKGFLYIEAPIILAFFVSYMIKNYLQNKLIILWQN